MLLVQSAHFLMPFVALETVTVAFYVLVAYGRHSRLTGLKYLIMGALSSSILLFGLCCFTESLEIRLELSSPDSLSYGALGEFIAFIPTIFLSAWALCWLSGICFKIGAVPFQIWVPMCIKVLPIRSQALAVASKAAGFVVLLQLLSQSSQV